MSTLRAGRHSGAVIIVTGGASGIGRACAKRLLDEGASVTIADVDVDAAVNAANELGEPDRVLAIAADVRTSIDCQRMVQSTLDAFGKLTGLVNAAGVNQPSQLIVDLTQEEWHRVLEINLTGTLVTIQAAAPHLERGGAIVTFASGAARVVRKGSAAYSVSKAGVLALTKVAALELGSKGIRVNAIAPGFIDTEMNRVKLTPERRAAIERSAPVGRVGSPDEVAAVTSFLLSDESSYICGDVIAVDGGVAASSRT